MQYTVKQACEQLGGISRSTLNRLVDAGHLTKKRSTTTPRRRVYITGESLDAYKKRQAAEHDTVKAG